MLDIVIAIACGIGIGVVAGLLPGLHPNNTIPIILGLSFIFSPMTAAVLLVSCGISNIFINFIPSILLGAPEDATVLGVLPGHRMLMQGKGFEAIKLSVLGAFGGVLFSVATLPIFSVTIPFIYETIRPHVHWLLIAAVIYMVSRERGFGKMFALSVFFLSGFLGMMVLDYSDAMLFPLLSGLFGLPTLLVSIWSKTALPKKFEDGDLDVDKKGLLKSVSIGSLSGVVAGLLPGLGSAQSTAITQQIFREKDDSGRKFLVSMGAISASDLIYSLLALYLIGNPRSGIAVGVSKLIDVGFDEMVFLVFIIVIVAALSICLTLLLTKISLSFLKKVNYSKLCLGTLLAIFGMIFIFSGFAGLVVAVVAMCIGLVPNYTNVKRTHSMGSLLLPTILFFAGIRVI